MTTTSTKRKPYTPRIKRTSIQSWMRQLLNLNLQKRILYPNRMRQFLNLNLQKRILNRNLTRGDGGE